MKKVELFLVGFAVTGLTLNLMASPFGGVLIILSLSALSVFYMYLSFALFNHIGFRQILKRASYRSISKLKIIGAILAGQVLAVFLTGILFKVQLWPGANQILVFGLLISLIAMIAGIVRYFKTRSNHFIQIFKRISIYGGLGLILLALPEYSLLEFKYRNYPEYVEAFKKANANPENDALWEKVDEEWKKIQNKKKN